MPGARLVRKFAFAFAALAVGCGVFSTIPIDELRLGNPAGRLFSPEHPPYSSGEVIFSHEAHTFAECSACHPVEAGEEGEEGAVRGAALPSMARCMECHDGKQAASSCETCHQLQRAGRKPPTHDGLFPRRHGEQAEKEPYQCSLCHLQSECQGCHSVRKPLSHTLRWERSAHGRETVHDRGSCATCHQADFCVNCHSQPPPDHTPSFLAGGHKQVARLRARSCLTCHRFGPDCSRCHGGE